ncbi:sensor histidine kinase [Dyella subtropica]|uniref:sensor histidine kinase n=1 Tax=Dyella subtropica TaxID=2992127 RepID=UPI00224EC3F2|nr:ATP-binding protein [Dyella subtropica]
MPALRYRKEEHRHDAVQADGQGHALIEVLPWPCIVFQRDGDTALTCNAAFREEFPQLEALPTRHAFESAFDVAGEQAGARIYYAPDTRRWYRMERRELGLGERADALFLTNMSDCIEVLRRHREQHEQLLSTSRMMSVGEMATTLAHELNQPLSAAINYLAGCEQIVDAEPAGNRLRQGIHLAKRQTERAAQIIGSIREFVRSREPHRQNLDARALIQGVIELLRLEAEKYQVLIVSTLPDDLPPIFADQVMIEQVLLNLIKNAIEAMHGTPPGRRNIQVSARLDYDDMVEIRVVDQGCGIDDNGMRRLFSPMYTTKPDGLGIGLAICRSIVEYHEGRLFAEPNREGGDGSALIFTVPRGLV